MKLTHKVFGTAALTAALFIGSTANASWYDFSGDYTMECEDITINMSMGFAYGDFNITNASIYLTDSFSEQVNFSKTFQCDELEFTDEDFAQMEDDALDSCNSLVTGWPEDVQAEQCDIAVSAGIEYLQDTVLTDSVNAYVLDNLVMDVYCQNYFFGFCLNYNTINSYTFSSGATASGNRILFGNGTWADDFSYATLLPNPLNCPAMSEAAMLGDASPYGEVKIDTGTVDAVVCPLANPYTTEVWALGYGYTIEIDQNGYE